ncbi:MAG: 30S ribosomal protein S14 [Candidatus Altiarchaeales archaeon]|nr:MAG: 30S ribosomal protein S14 [Candidatus Altiarchaeales archaeon]RLI95094.1 MAG: 30S ribosomal protein S14 [Candidatus Altiarchaeales archaeon]RLI95488.1 MAG: 30S ribosomal protein S14 [Candidatus Altiarchaeales archaeon]HDO81934.1 30S ribosomal protein S14 [Candidatus Altiarchaeales archaeon]HEX54583.1 30S ribosomal protein S14 [Candidatus Altiarchaeales archaeon]
MQKKNMKIDARNLRCPVCGTTRGLIHKYGLNICRRCFREKAESIGFKKYS